MEDCSTGTSIDNACKKLGVSRTAFYTRKYLTEMIVIDQQAFDVMKNEALSEKKTLWHWVPQQALQGEDSYVSLKTCGETT